MDRPAPARLTFANKWHQLKQLILTDRNVRNQDELLDTYQQIFKLFDQNLSASARAVEKAEEEYETARGTPEAPDKLRNFLDALRAFLDKIGPYEKQIEFLKKGFNKKHPQSPGGFSYVERVLNLLATEAEAKLSALEGRSGEGGN